MDDIRKCAACGDTRAAPYTTKKGYALFRCRSCRSIFVDPLPSRPESMYTKAYFCGGGSCGGYTDYDRDKGAMHEAFARTLALLEEKSGGPGKLLDIGAATGFFLELAGSRRWQTSGIEISSYAVREAQRKGLAVEEGSVTTVTLPNGTFDVVTLWDVFEHLPNPRESLAAAYRLLKPGGLLALTTPDASSLWARLVGPRWHLLNPPEHIVCCTKTGMKTILTSHGFRVDHLGSVAKRFSLPYIFHIGANWLDWSFLRRLAEMLDTSFFRRFAIPLNFHDNMFVIAVKIKT